MWFAFKVKKYQHNVFPKPAGIPAKAVDLMFPSLKADLWQAGKTSSRNEPPSKKPPSRLLPFQESSQRLSSQAIAGQSDYKFKHMSFEA